MTTFKQTFAGPINRVEIKAAGQKTIAEVSMCKKNRSRQGEEDSFTWIRITVWEPPEWMQAKLVKGAFIAGTGDFMLRSYLDAQGVKKTSAEVRCTSFDVEVGGSDSGGEAAQPPVARKAPQRPAPTAPADDDFEPPF